MPDHPDRAWERQMVEAEEALMRTEALDRAAEKTPREQEPEVPIGAALYEARCGVSVPWEALDRGTQRVWAHAEEYLRAKLDREPWPLGGVAQPESPVSMRACHVQAVQAVLTRWFGRAFQSLDERTRNDLATEILAAADTGI